MAAAGPLTGTQEGRLAGLDRLRALAAGSVLVYHVWRFGAPDGQPADAGPLTPVMPHLWHGVTLFFVLSGFLLYRPFAAAVLRGTTLPGLGRYARKRLLRILPAYWVVLLATAFVLESAMVADGPGPRTEGVPGPELLLVNFLLLQNFSPDTIFTGVGPAWSLAVEACFYAALPLLAVLAVAAHRCGAGRRAGVLLPAVALLAAGATGKLAALGPAGWDLGVARSLWGLADLFAVGMLVAVVSVEVEDGRCTLPSRWRPLAVTAIALVAAVGLLTGATHMTPLAAGALLYTSLVGVACALLVALVALPAAGRPGRLARVPELRAVTAAGLVSYSVFLWHEPLLRWLRINGLTLDGAGGFAVNVAVTAVATAVLAILTYRLVEAPALRLKLRRPAVPRPALGKATAGVGAVMGIGLIGVLVAACGTAESGRAGAVEASTAPPGELTVAPPAAERDASAGGEAGDEAGEGAGEEAGDGAGEGAPRTRFSRIPGVTTARALGPLGAEGIDRWEDEVPRVRDVRIRSTADGRRQPALWLPSRREGPRPLLVVLHSWSNGYKQHLGIPYARWAQRKGWTMIAPNFRGINDKPAAAGSDRAVQDVVDAIDYAIAEGDIDRERVFVIGFSGGGMMSLLMAGRHPDRIAGAVAWVPVHDLRLWHRYNASFIPPRDYARHIERFSGGDPSRSERAREKAGRRSPSTYLDRARRAGVPIYIGHGVDDTLVLPTHAARAFNQLADPEDRIGERSMRRLAANELPAHLREREAATYFDGGDPGVRFSRRSGAVTLVLFEGEHDMVFNPGLEWMTRVGWPRAGKR